MHRKATGSRLTVAGLKEVGNKHYVAKRFEQAITYYTQAVNMEENGADILKSMCFLNRALCKKHTMRESKGSLESIEKDIKASLRCNYRYAKAYVQLCKLYMKEERFMDAYIELMCAVELREGVEIKEAEMLSKIKEQALEEFIESWLLQAGNDSTAPRDIVPHTLVVDWLYGTQNDIIAKTIIKRKNKTNNRSFFENALKMVHEKKYVDVAKVAEEEDPSAPNFLESCLLAARFYSYQRLHEKATKMMECFTREVAYSMEMNDDRKKELVYSKHLVQIQCSLTTEAVLRAFSDAKEHDRDNADYYLMTANQLTYLDNRKLAIEILDDACTYFPDNFNIQCEYHMNNLAEDDISFAEQQIKLKAFLKTHKSMAIKRAERKLTPIAFSHMATIFLMLENKDNAIKYINMAISKSDNVAQFSMTKSLILESCADTRGAASCAKKALLIEPYNHTANCQVAMQILGGIPRYLKTDDVYADLFDALNRSLKTITRDVVACRRVLLNSCKEMLVEMAVRKRIPL